MWAIAIAVGSAMVVSVLATMLATRVMFALENESSRVEYKVVKVFLPLSLEGKRNNILADLNRSIVEIRVASERCEDIIEELVEDSPERAVLEVEKEHLNVKAADLKAMRERKRLQWALEDHDRDMDRLRKGIR